MENVCETLRQSIDQFLMAGSPGRLIGPLGTMLAIDYVTAVLCALLGKAKHGGRLSSRIGFLGILRKSLIFVVVGIACLIDKALGSETLCSLTIKAFIVNEGISAIQNIALIGTWIPPALQNALQRALDRKRGGERSEI